MLTWKPLELAATTSEIRELVVEQRRYQGPDTGNRKITATGPALKHEPKARSTCHLDREIPPDLDPQIPPVSHRLPEALWYVHMPQNYDDMVAPS